MRTIALINQKGGCGKTTCSINLAACLAQLQQRTLLADMDPQGHCAVGLAVPENQIERNMHDVLAAAGAGPTLKEIAWQIAPNFDLVPSSIALAALEPELHDTPGRQDRLADALAAVAQHYDYCVIDCPPNVGLLTFNALRACDEVIIPVETGFFSLHSLARQLELLESLRKQCRQEVRVRILATLYDNRTKLAREVLGDLRQQFGEMLMEATINFNTKLKEAASFGQPITEYDPASKGFRDFVTLARELMGPQPRITLNVGDALEQSHLASAPPVAPVPLSPPRPVRSARPSEPFDPRHQDPHEQRQYAPSATSGGGTAVLEAPPRPAVAVAKAAPVVPAAQSTLARAAQDLRQQAETLARRAQEIRTTAQRELGLSNRPAVTAAPAPAPTDRKIPLGARRVAEGMMFTMQFSNASQVAIAGDFNGWSPTATQLQNLGEPSIFRAIVALPPGRYRYRVVVDGHWQADPFNPQTEPNPFGETNSIVEVG